MATSHSLKHIAEIEAQLDSSVPYYLPSLVRDFKATLTVLARWQKADAAVIDIRGQRDACRCELMEPSDDIGNGFDVCRRQQPADKPEWCQPCLDREPINTALIAAKKELRLATQQLRRYLQRALESQP